MTLSQHRVEGGRDSTEAADDGVMRGSQEAGAAAVPSGRGKVLVNLDSGWEREEAWPSVQKRLECHSGRTKMSQLDWTAEDGQ